MLPLNVLTLTLAALLCIGMSASAADGPDQAGDAPPLISIIYKKNLKPYGKLISTAASMFEGLPIEVKMGSDKIASKSSRVIFYVTGLDVIGEQRFDNFIRTTRVNGLPISAAPVVAGWKNLAVQVDYMLIVPVQKGRPKKVSGRAVGIAQGKGGTSFDVKLDNNAESLLRSAFEKAARQLQYELLRTVVKSEMPSPRTLLVIDSKLKDDDGPYFFQAHRAGIQQGQLVAEFAVRNEFPFDIEVEPRYFALTQGMLGRDTTFYRVDLDIGRRQNEVQPWIIATQSNAKHRIEAPIPDRLTNGRESLLGVYAIMKVARFRTRTE